MGRRPDPSRHGRRGSARSSSSRASRAPDSDLGARAREGRAAPARARHRGGPHRLLLGPPARRRRADRRRARGDGPRARAVLALPRRRRAARRGRLDPRRRQRRELGLPAGAVRRGVGDRRARRGRPHARAGGRRDRRLGRDLRALRRLPPAAARVHAARRRRPPVLGGRRAARRRRSRRCCRCPSDRSSCRHESTASPPAPRGWASSSAPGLGAVADALEDAEVDPLHRAARLPGAERARPRRHARARHAVRPAGRLPAGPQARLRGRRPGRHARPGARAEGRRRRGAVRHQRGRLAQRRRSAPAR